MGFNWRPSRQLFGCILLCSLHSDFSLGARMELEGPSLILEPPPVTYFSNTVGVTLTCLGRGHPPLVTSWLSPNGDTLPQIPGLRESLQNGSLYFGSFRLDEYTPDIHNGQLRCSVTNPVGTFLSTIFSVRAVVESAFDLYITGFEEGDTIEGNPVVLQCHISPSTYSDFIQVVTWKSVDQFGYQTEIQSDGIRYQITPRGSLVIFSAKNQQQLFVCVAQNVLNKKTQSSPPFLVKSTKGIPAIPSLECEEAIESSPTEPSRIPKLILFPSDDGFGLRIGFRVRPGSLVQL